MTENNSAWVNEAQCQAVGERLRALGMPRRELGILLGGQPDLPARRLMDYYFYLNSLLFDFRGFDVVAGWPGI